MDQAPVGRGAKDAIEPPDALAPEGREKGYRMKGGAEGFGKKPAGREQGGPEIRAEKAGDAGRAGARAEGPAGLRCWWGQWPAPPPGHSQAAGLSKASQR